MLKARKLGYDGRGNATCPTPASAEEAFARLDAGEGVLVEKMVGFERELAVMVARSTTGERAVYPVVETIQRDHVCHEVRAPATLEPGQTHRAADVAAGAAEAAGSLGVMGVEMFLVDDDIVVNELAPRPHNSGHYTIEACETSQFENHLRGVLGLPLGSPEMLVPAAVMINLLGTRSAASHPRIGPALAVRGAHLHLYDKRELRPGRKMGHVTCLGRDLSIAHSRASRAASEVGL
jgi:5-(carboxyamino)imidazole ribonucleotide synthase